MDKDSSMVDSQSDTEKIKDHVLQLLRGQKIKLWLPPYVNDRGESVESVLQGLVDQQQWKNDPMLQLHSSQSSALVLQSLKELQLHALAKWQQKHQTSRSPTSVTARLPRIIASSVHLELRILGLSKEAAAALDCSSHSCSFATTVQLVTDQNSPSVVLRLNGVSPMQATSGQLLDFLRAVFETNNVRVIHRGQTFSTDAAAADIALGALLQTTTTTTSTTPNTAADGTALGALLQTTTTTTSTTPNTATADFPVVPLLCMVFPRTSDNSNGNDNNSDESTTLASRIAAIRQAARQIRDTTQLEITDQHGATVPMSADDRLGFLTALALHRMGVQSQSSELSTNSKEDSLVLLLEADTEWRKHPRLQAWKDKVDNYGLLMLDIAWVYLQLESLDNLPDSIQRLEEAERVLRKQVHKNFVTLAMAQAEMGNYKEVPPLAAVFAKLFLLQGIAYLCHSRQNSSTSSATKSQERLDQAYCLLQSLRMLAPADAVQQLLEVSQRDTITPADAIAALRQSQGDIDAAALALADGEMDRQQRQRDREVQHQYGVCENERDPVNLGQVDKLRPLLRTGGSDGDADADADSHDLAVGLLRLANNDLTRALDLYVECGHSADTVLEKVGALDERLVQRGLLDRAVWRSKKRKLSRRKEKPVDEMALVTLLSMGVEDSKARLALQKSANSVDRALLWLSTVAETEPDGGNGTEGGDRAQGGSSAAPTEEPANNEKDETMAEDAATGTGVDGNSGPTEGEETAGSEGAPRGRRDLQRDLLERAARELLHRELGDILEERDLSKEYLGKSLDEEWRLVLKYRGQK